MLKNKTVCFSGHRKLNSAEAEFVYNTLLRVIEELIKAGYIYYGSGGALGFDTVAAYAVLKLKEKYPYIKLILVLPCRNQTAFWQRKDQKSYESLKKRADKIVYTENLYCNGCMQKRNRHLVENSSVLVCYLKKSSGGTAYTLRYAKEKGLKIINVAHSCLSILKS